VPPIGPQARDQVIDPFLRALDDLQETRAIEGEQACDPIERIELPRGSVDLMKVLVGQVEASTARICE
jgi:hypothetical protein